MKTAYVNLYTLTQTQNAIIRFIDYWVHVEKDPIPQKEVIQEMTRRGRNTSTVVSSLNGLIKLGYIRRSVKISNTTSYVQIRRPS